MTAPGLQVTPLQRIVDAVEDEDHALLSIHEALEEGCVVKIEYPGINLSLLLLAQIRRTKRCPIDSPVDSADQASTTHDIAECDRHEIVDDPRDRNR